MSENIRKPYDNESDDCARLLYISGPQLYSYIFAAGPPGVYKLIRVLLNLPGSMMSGDCAFVEEEGGKIRGMILAYPASAMKMQSLKSVKSLKNMFMISGPLNFFRILFRLSLNRYFPGTENDELFISNLAVFEEHRGKGIGIKLLKKAEELAAENGLDKLSLYVETDNTHAGEVYEKYGFTKVKTSLLPEKYHKHGLFGFYKMVKIL